MQSIPSNYNSQHRKFTGQNITDIVILYLLTEGLRGMKFPFSTIYATYVHMIAYANQRYNDLANCNQLIINS